MDSILADVRQAIRMLASKRGFAAVALLTIALGIGINTIIFSVVSAVLLRDLPYSDPQRLFAVFTIMREQGGQQDIFSPGNFLSVQSMNRSFEAVSVVDYTSFDLTTPGGEPKALQTARVSGDFWRVLKAQPWMGSTFTAKEDRPGNDRVAVLSHSTWRNDFAADPQIIGRIIQLNSTPYTVIGVMGPQFAFPEGIDMWAPVAFTEEQASGRGNIYLQVIARTKPGVTESAAQKDLQDLAARLEREYPDTNRGVGMTCTSLLESLVGDVRRPLIVLAAAVGFVLLIACANLANLLLANASTRSREFAVRKALGASRLRLLQQLMTESVVLSLLGGALGVVLSFWALPILKGMIPSQIPRVAEIGLDWSVLLFTFGISIATGLLFGVAPALSFTRGDLQNTLKEGERTTGGLQKRRLGGLLIVAEVTLVLVMLTGAGLMIQSFMRLRSVNPGFRADGLLSFQLFLPQSRYPDVEKRRAFYFQLEERLKSIGGVESIGITNPAPFSAGQDVADVNYEAQGSVKVGESIAYFTRANADFFRAMRIPLLQGRAFTPQDETSEMLVCVINETLARKHWPGQNPIGREIKLGRQRSLSLQVIGVAGDVKHLTLDSAVRPEMYIPYAQRPGPGLTLLIRTSLKPDIMADAIQSRVQELDPNLPVQFALSFQDLIARSTAPARLNTYLVASFAGLALLLAVVGLYGLVAYSVSRQTRDIGVRVALGARPSNILLMVLKNGMTLVVAGLIAGVALSLALTRYLSSILYEVSTTDPVVYVLVALVLLGTTLLACYIPARRAAKMDPLVALRYE